MRQKSNVFQRILELGLLIFLVCAFPSPLPAAERAHVLVISIDGMRPDYVTDAAGHHLNIPTLRGFMKNGVYADGVVGVIPTLTYPSHTTLMTGVWPREHGVYANRQFDPFRESPGPAITAFSTIHVETLWQAAHQSGYTTASVGWPITTGSRWIDYLMPANPDFETKPPQPGVWYDRPHGLRKILDQDLPRGKSLNIDQRRFSWTLSILRRYKPDFMTTHLGRLDHAQHLTGPFSERSDRTIERIDARVARLIQLERKNDPKSYIVIVSDHGFEPIAKKVNLGVLFVRKGLLRPPSGDHAGSWDAALWITGATAYVMLHHPSDAAVRNKVTALLLEAAGNPDYGISQILTHAELVNRGGNPKAAFMIELRPGFVFGYGLSGEVVVPDPGRGTHGYLPDRPALYASFLMMGPDVARGRDLGIVDMRQIGPTIARILGVRLAQAEQAPLDYEK